MSVGYVSIQWNRNKRVYDALLAIGIGLYLGLFILTGRMLYRGPHQISEPILVMRALGTCAFVLLHVTLCIGPLARLDRRFLPLLYNRRHLGVTTFFIGLAHASLAIGFYHGFGRVNPLVSLLTSNTNYASLSAFPFQILGLAALLILFLMAATSHDFWLRFLGPFAWKSLHMLVYVAFALLVMHVALGILQTHRSVWLAALVGAGVVLVSGLHVAAGVREIRKDMRTGRKVPAARTDWAVVCGLNDAVEMRGGTFPAGGGERIAVFRIGNRLSATSNVCAHQGGPLGEGRIIDGCITCPWHGWQYQPENGQSPPPFTERIPTHRLRAAADRMEVELRPCAPGTPVEPLRVEESRHDG